MATLDRQREILFCLTALESRYADVEQLAAVLSGWVDIPTASLAELLVDRGILSDTQRDGLSQAVADRLAGSDKPADTCSIWQTLPPPLQGPFAKGFGYGAEGPPTRAGHDVRESQHEEQTSQVPAAPVSGSGDERFQVIELYAQRGLGDVFIAHDQQLARTVALKQIKSRWADDAESRMRAHFRTGVAMGVVGTGAPSP